MGSIASYQAAAGRRYRVRWRDDSTHRQVEKRGFRTKRDAEIFLARTEVARRDGWDKSRIIGGPRRTKRVRSPRDSAAL